MEKAQGNTRVIKVRLTLDLSFFGLQPEAVVALRRQKPLWFHLATSMILHVSMEKCKPRMRKRIQLSGVYIF